MAELQTESTLNPNPAAWFFQILPRKYSAKVSKPRRLACFCENIVRHKHRQLFSRIVVFPLFTSSFAWDNLLCKWTKKMAFCIQTPATFSSFVIALCLTAVQKTAYHSWARNHSAQFDSYFFLIFGSFTVKSLKLHARNSVDLFIDYIIHFRFPTYLIALISCILLIPGITTAITFASKIVHSWPGLSFCKS